MKISESKQGTWTVLTISGKIDHNGAEELERVLMPLASGGSIAVDFRGVEYVTSSGFRVLMHAEREQHARNGKLVLTNMRDVVRQLFDVAGLSQHFKIAQDLAAISSKPAGGPR